MPRFGLSATLLPLILLLAASVLPQAQAASTGQLGCISTTEVTAKATGTAAVQKTSSDACNSYCSSSGLYTYAAYAAGAVAATNNCFCLTDTNFVDAKAWSAPSSANTLCTATGLATLVDIKTTFVYSTCYAPTSLVSGLVSVSTGVLGTPVTSPDQCFQQCSGSTGAYIAPYVTLLGSATYGCVCAGTGVSVTGAAASCGLGNFIAYTHPAAAQVSNLARRQAKAYTISIAGRKEMARQQERAEKWTCPRGMKACAIGGAQGSWECVDPLADLESCGGCPNGDYIPDQTSTNSTATGLDCTTMPGLLRGSATCLNGVCQALACKRGWTIVDGACAQSQDDHRVNSVGVRLISQPFKRYGQ